MRLLIVTLLFLTACNENQLAPAADVAPAPELIREVDANCGLVDACDGLEMLSDDGEFKCKREKVSPFWSTWSGVDFAGKACYTTYRLQSKDPACDLAAPNQMCSSPFGSVPCCHYEDVDGGSLEEILPLKPQCDGAYSC
jgi:hypothetical protein